MLEFFLVSINNDDNDMKTVLTTNRNIDNFMGWISYKVKTTNKLKVLGEKNKWKYNKENHTFSAYGTETIVIQTYDREIKKFVETPDYVYVMLDDVMDKLELK